MATKKTTKRTAPKKKKAAKPAKAKPKPKVESAAIGRKVAHLKDMPIDDWLAQRTSGWQGELISKMLGVVQRAVPKSTVSIKWGQPVFSIGGPFAYIRQAKTHVTFGFWQDIELKDPAGLLKDERGRSFTLTQHDKLDVKGVTALVRGAAAQR